MASIGLKVLPGNDNLGTGLAGVLSKSLFGDPEMQAKAQLYASEVGAHQAYASKLAADQALIQAKTKEEQDAETERLRAGPLVGEAAAGAVPMPVPVQNVGQNYLLPGGKMQMSAETGDVYDAPPAVVDPQALAQANALKARERALGPILVRGTPTQVAEGVGKDYGGAILAGAAANPAIVQPDTLRIAGGLYTGTAPSTTTVWSGGDTSGVDAAAREKILEEAAKPQAPIKQTMPGGGERILIPNAAGGPGAVQPAPGSELPPEMKIIDGKPYIMQSDGSLQPASGFVQPPTKLGDKERLVAPAGSPAAAPVQTVPGSEPVQPPDKVVLDEKGSRDFISTLSTKIQQGYKPTLQEASTYAEAFNAVHAAKSYQFRDPVTNEEKTATIQEPIAPGIFNPMEVFRAGGFAPAAPPVPGGPAAPPVPGGPPSPLVPASLNPPVAPNVQTIAKGPPPPPDATEQRTRLFANSAGFANAALDKVTKPPGSIQAFLAMPGVSGTGLLAAVARSNLDDATKAWARNALEFTAAINYEQSGAAVNPDEWENAKQIYIPMPLDGPKQLADKAAARHNWIVTMAKNGYGRDPGAMDVFLKQYGIDPNAPPPVQPPATPSPPDGTKPPISSFFK